MPTQSDLDPLLIFNMRNFGAYRGYVFLNPYISSVIIMIIAKGPKAAKKVLLLNKEPYFKEIRAFSLIQTVNLT